MEMPLMPAVQAEDGELGEGAGEQWEEPQSLKDHDEVEAEEVQPAKKAPDPVMPSPAEIEAHRENHLPFRSWCLDCTLARAMGELHRRRQEGVTSTVPVVAMDYFFMTASDVYLSKEAAGYQSDEAVVEAVEAGKVVKCLVVKCTQTKAVTAFTVPQKGVDPDRYASTRVTKFIEWLGHTKVILKADGEPAMKALIKDALKILRVSTADLQQVGEEHSPEYDSKGNGSAESAIRRVRELFRTIRSCLQRRLEKTIDITHPVMSWMLEHTAHLQTALVRGKDGRTPWQKVRGREFNMRSLGFGEECTFKLPAKGPRFNKDGNMTNRSELGIFLGYDDHTNQYVYAAQDGIHMSRSVQRRPTQERWQFSKIAEIKATPWNLKEVRERGVMFREGHEPHPPLPAEREIKPRQLKIYPRDLERFGHTEGCAQCEHIMKYRENRPGLAHTAACRERLMREMAGTEDMRHRVEGQEQRLTRYLAERIEEDDQRKVHGGEPHNGADGKEAEPDHLPDELFDAPAANQDPRDQPSNPVKSRTTLQKQWRIRLRRMTMRWTSGTSGCSMTQ